jgi:hypothetical protein
MMSVELRNVGKAWVPTRHGLQQSGHMMAEWPPDAGTACRLLSGCRKRDPCEALPENAERVIMGPQSGQK